MYFQNISKPQFVANWNKWEIFWGIFCCRYCCTFSKYAI